MSNKRQRAVTVNDLSLLQLEAIVRHLKSEKWVIPVQRGTETYYECTLQPTKDAKGNDKHPQCTITRFAPLEDGKQHKQLVHLIWWRWENNGRLIPDELHISHLDKNPRVLRLTAESRDLNESRKYCHLFGWYKALPGEDSPRCPHKEMPCSGP